MSKRLDAGTVIPLLLPDKFPSSWPFLCPTTSVTVEVDGVRAKWGPEISYSFLFMAFALIIIALVIILLHSLVEPLLIQLVIQLLFIQAVQ